MHDIDSEVLTPQHASLVAGVYVTLTPIILVDLLGVERLSVAFGWVLLCQGIATALGPPIAGLHLH